MVKAFKDLFTEQTPKENFWHLLPAFCVSALKPRTVIVKTDYGKFLEEGSKQIIDS